MSNHGQLYRLRFDDTQPTVPLDEAVLWVDESATPARIHSKRAGSGGFEAIGVLNTLNSYSTTQTLDSTHKYVTMDASGGARTVNLPPAALNAGRYYSIKKIDTSTNKVTIDPNASEHIDRALTRKLYEPGESIGIVCDGADWHIVEQTGIPKSYDGTRWLGPEKSIPWSDRNTTQPFALPSGVVAEYRIRMGKTIWLKTWAVSTHVTGTNDGSNYVTVALLKASDASDLVSLITAADTVDTWVQQTEITSFGGNPFTPASVEGFAVEMRVTGSPTGIYLDHDLIYQDVYT